MEFIKEDDRIYLKDENGKIVAEITFEKQGENIYNINHTFVDESLRGKGIASKLVEEAVKLIKEKNGVVKATCSYANKWLKDNNL